MKTEEKLRNTCKKLKLKLKIPFNYGWTRRESNSELTHAKGTVYHLPTGPSEYYIKAGLAKYIQGIKIDSALDNFEVKVDSGGTTG